MEPLDSAKYNQLALAGGGWEGIIELVMSADLELPGFLADKYAGKPGFFNSMVVPDDYKKAVDNAITAPDFKQKQNWTQEALKLMTDKYCLLLPLVKDYDVVISGRSVRDTGLYEFLSPTHWTPEDAWLQR